MEQEEHKICLYDRDIRDPLFEYLEERFGKTRIFEEKRIGRARADILMLTPDSIVGLEIKSDADTYERLKRQVRYYNQYCDRNYVVVGKSHERHVEEHVPDFWGILVVYADGGGVAIEERRAAGENSKMKREAQITLMWRPELQRLLKQNQLPGYQQKSKRFVQQKLLEKLEWGQLKPQLCEELFQRDYTLWNEELEQYRNRGKKIDAAHAVLEYKPHKVRKRRKSAVSRR